MPIGLTSLRRGARTVQLQDRPQVRLVFSLGLWTGEAGRITYPTEADAFRLAGAVPFDRLFTHELMQPERNLGASIHSSDTLA